MSRRRTNYGQSKPPAGTPTLHRDVPGSAAWLLNETGGALARDSRGNDHGVFAGTTLVREPSPRGGYGAISGWSSASYITTTRTPKTAYTLVARIKTPSGGGSGNIFSAVGTAYVLHYFSGSGQFQFWTSTEFWSGTNIGSALAANRWYTMAFVREGNSITNGYKLYYDGMLAGAANSGSLAAPSNPFWVGGRSDGYGQPWDGLIDWVQWYERALPAAEIQQLHLDPFRAWAPPGPRFLWTPGPPPPPPPLTGDAALTQGADTLSAAGTVAVAGAAAITQAGQTLSAAGAIEVAGAAALTQTEDSLSSAGAVSVAGTAALTQTADSVSGDGAVAVAGAAAVAQAADTTAGAGEVAVVGAASVSQGADATAGAGAVGVAGASALAQAADTAAGAGTLTITGSSVAAQAGDVTSGAGTVMIGGSGVPVQSNAIAAAGAVLIVGSAALTQAGQLTIASGSTLTTTVVRRFRCDGRGIPNRFPADGSARGFRCDGRGIPNRFPCNEAAR